MDKGKVWLVGCGPYDLGLLTIKAKDIIEKADVIVYDRLVSHSIISLSKEDAILVDVGKRANNHTMPQEQINKTLVEYALKGKSVVRLKGGDPFLFGRGGEEIDELLKNNIKYEVICGITSAISVPAYFGIPVTHREYSSSLHIIAGHKKDGETLDIDFDSLVKLKGTLVFLMGISSLNQICDGLLNAGINKNIPVCILENGTSYNQRKIQANISDIVNIAMKENIKTPAIIVIGEVCSLSEKYDWRSNLILNGLRILVTRPKNANSILSKKLRDYGADVIEIPTIKTKVLENDKIRSTLNNISKYNYIILTSPYGAEEFFRKLREFKIDIRNLFNVKFGVVGKATGKVLEQIGIFPDIIPEKYYCEELAIKLVNETNKNDKFLIVKPKEGTHELLEILNKNNIDFDEIILYETIYEKFNPINYEFDYNDIVTFTSSSSVKGFINSMESQNINYKDLIAVCIGKKTENEARKYGMNTYCADEQTIDSLISKVIEVYKEIKNG